MARNSSRQRQFHWVIHKNEKPVLFVVKTTATSPSYILNSFHYWPSSLILLFPTRNSEQVRWVEHTIRLLFKLTYYVHSVKNRSHGSFLNY